MTAASTIERRRNRRVDLPVEVSFRSVDDPTSTPPIIGEAKDVGLAGVFVVTQAPFRLSAGTSVNYSIDIPPEQQKQFPFTRVLGTGWIVRVIPQTGGQEVGIAIAFTGDITALSSAQS